MRDFMKWIWRILFIALVVSLFESNIGRIQIALVLGIIVLRVIIVETDRTIY